MENQGPSNSAGNAWKCNIDTQNDGLEKVSPVRYGSFGYPGSMLNFRGVNLSGIDSL